MRSSWLYLIGGQPPSHWETVSRCLKERLVIPNGCEGSKKDLSLRFETRISPGACPELGRRARNDTEAKRQDILRVMTLVTGSVYPPLLAASPAATPTGNSLPQ